MIKNLFGKSAKKESDKELSVEDLVTLERFDEAAEKLRQRLKLVPKDLYAHLKLAEVYVALKEVTKALDEYGYVADMYADDGFFDKGIALLGRAAKLAPGDDMLPRRIERYKAMKLSEARRRLAIEGLRENKTAMGGATAGDSALEIELLWNKIAKSHVVAQLEAETLKKLFSVMEMMRLKTGTVLAEEGSNLPYLFMVVDGTVDATAVIGGRSLPLKSFTTGDLIGDSALFEHKPWPATYTVQLPAVAFKLGREGLESVLVGQADPIAFLSVLRQQHHDRDIAAAAYKLRA